MSAVPGVDDFPAVARQWDLVSRRASAGAHDAARRDVVRWLADLQRLEAAERSSRAAGRWVRGPADLMAVLRLHRDEVRNCRVLGWLLDPAAAHGLGVRMLRAVLDQVAPGVAASDDTLADVVVVLEDGREDTRADIVARGDGWSLVIEAKIDAAEGDRQGERLERLWGDGNPSFCFLTRDGRAMTTGSPRWLPLRWSDIARHLRAALGDAPAASGRAAAKEYLRALETHLR